MYRTVAPLILASASPRRREYLLGLGLLFEVHTVPIVEEPLPGEDHEGFVRRMAQEKASAVGQNFPEHWVIGGDTVVCLDKVILGKPADPEDAVRMLMALSGKEHLVRSAFCVAHLATATTMVQSVSTRVFFAAFPESVARAYVATGEPLDKAGAYGIQGWGAALVTAVEGSYTSVVGLPLAELVRMLLTNGIIAAGDR
ncbi:MAG: Maf family protein [Desulforhopalus sp.]|nr:Maf family protein [Desulforhopalus sp.]